MRPYKPEISRDLDEPDDWSPTLGIVTGYDWIVGTDGVPYLLEANGSTFALPEYAKLYGTEELARLLLPVFDGFSSVGVNVPLELDPIEWPTVTFEANFVRKILSRRYEVVNFDERDFVYEDGRFLDARSNRSFAALFSRLPFKTRHVKLLWSHLTSKSPVVTHPWIRRTLVDKMLTYEAVRRSVPAPYTRLAQRPEEVMTFAREVALHRRQRRPEWPGKELIVKPVDGTGSRGVHAVELAELSAMIPSMDYPLIVQERIEAQTFNDRFVDVRSFMFGELASRGIARIAALPAMSMSPARFITSITAGGSITGLDERASAQIASATRLAACAIEKFALAEFGQQRAGD